MLKWIEAKLKKFFTPIHSKYVYELRTIHMCI
jgi:hypothetical protein